MAAAFTVNTTCMPLVLQIFCTLYSPLSADGWKMSSRFLHLMNKLYQGILPVEHLTASAEELAQIKRELAQFTPDQVIWDIDDRPLTPSWGDDITNLSSCFVTGEENDFLTAFSTALNKAQKKNVPLTIRIICVCDHLAELSCRYVA